MARLLVLLLLALSLGCGSGGEGRSESTSRGGSDRANFDCSGECDNQSLSVSEIEQIIGNAARAAKVLGLGATIAVTDRVGNVLAVATTPGALTTARLDGAKGSSGGLEGAVVPATLAAISKAGTGAYLSSQGNAFSTATASLIIQENFLPGEERAPGGPLFGVQFSQLPCSDLMVSPARVSTSGSTGPKALPLGLSGDPGGFPLYKNGDLVGGVGVEIDGLYTVDTAPRERKQPVEEVVALSASLGFEAPSERTADNIFVAGKNLIYSSVKLSDLPELPAAEVAEFSITAVRPFFSGSVRAGAQFGTPESGYVRTTRAGVQTVELVDSALMVRFPTRSATPLPGGADLKGREVDAILDSAIMVAAKARAAIRRPLDSSARVTVFVVDTTGEPIGFVRSADAPVFGTDVALQKARTALQFSSGGGIPAGYTAQLEALTGLPLSGALAFSSRAVGNLSRPFFPDGINGNPAGPLSKPFPGQWSPFNTGLQLDLIQSAIVAPLSGSFPSACSEVSKNGIQIFAGGVPLYKGDSLVGAIGVSGDGIDQDDMVAFYGVSRKGLDEAGHPGVGDSELGFNAPLSKRSDTVGVRGNLRYVNCPEAPFIGSNARNVCGDL